MSNRTMMLREVRPASDDFQTLVALADEIWHEYFPALLTSEQIDYMVERFQSAQALEQQMREGYRYFLLSADAEVVGYLGIQLRKPEGCDPGGAKNSAANDIENAVANSAENTIANSTVNSAANNTANTIANNTANSTASSGSLFISKLYLRASARGLGAGRFAIEQCMILARQNGLSRLGLTCNKHNTSSLAFYERCGFRTVGSTVSDIGSGFVMDDYLLELVVS